MKSFALIGAAGYIAPRHLSAIKETGNTLVACIDKSDSVGIIDSYFPQASFFTEFERFDRHLEKIKRTNNPIDYLSVCSPNYLHDAHCRFGLRHGTNVICEKPVVLNPWNIDALASMEKETGGKIYSILQLRLHPAIVALKQKIAAGPSDKMYSIDLTYITSRGPWYYASWKGDQEKSGGIATNIGIHFFDMLSWIFGKPTENSVHIHSHDRAAGKLTYKNAEVRWFLSINGETLPQYSKSSTIRSMIIDNVPIDFSKGFKNLHAQSYSDILNGKGFTLSDSKNAIQTVYEIRNSEPLGLLGDYHPLAKLKLNPHPFKGI